MRWGFLGACPPIKGGCGGLAPRQEYITLGGCGGLAPRQEYITLGGAGGLPPDKYLIEFGHILR